MSTTSALERGMPHPVYARTASGPQPAQPATPTRLTATDDAHVRVRLQRLYFFSRDLGLAPEAARSSSISQVERQTVLDIDRGAQTLGLVGAGQPPITVTLRDTMANAAGPYAAGDQVGVPTGNVIADAARTLPNGGNVVATNQLFPYDVALHELGHVVQSEAMAAAGMTQLERATHATGISSATGVTGAGEARVTGNVAEASGLREGLSDATAALVTHDWVVGEGYFGPGSSVRAVRDVTRPAAADTMETIETDYRRARAGLDHTGPASHMVNGVEVHDDEGHSLGGIVSRSAYEFQQRRGWEEASALIATVQRDPALWRTGGTFEAYRDRFLAAARQIDTQHPGALDAARQSLRAVGYDVAGGDAGGPATPPSIAPPRDPGGRTAGPGTNGIQPLPAAGSIALNTGVGAAIGAAVGGVLALVTPLNLKTGLVLGTIAGGGLGALRGAATNL